mmetsp:Transcript_36732/g.82310  ORF Transcript_36732/g.82310 Transcript_36732/m.82310 type:complete len:211 (+) Transcript_36732:46-678(+)
MSPGATQIHRVSKFQIATSLAPLSSLATCRPQKTPFSSFLQPLHRGSSEPTRTAPRQSQGFARRHPQRRDRMRRRRGARARPKMRPAPEPGGARKHSKSCRSPPGLQRPSRSDQVLRRELRASTRPRRRPARAVARAVSQKPRTQPSAAGWMRRVPSAPRHRGPARPRGGWGGPSSQRARARGALRPLTAGGWPAPRPGRARQLGHRRRA